MTWLPPTYDPDLNLLYVPTGNPNQVFAPRSRKGDNLFTCSLVALNPDTGKMAWYFQTSPHDTHDWVAAVAAKAGMQQGLHNEGFELSMVDGQRTYDILMRLLDPNLVKFQFQMSMIGQGFVAHEYFTKYPGRFFRCTYRTSI